jgi:hypothetical protein
MKYTFGTSRPRSSCIGHNRCTFLWVGTCRVGKFNLSRLPIILLKVVFIQPIKPVSLHSEFDLGLRLRVLSMTVVIYPFRLRVLCHLRDMAWIPRTRRRSINSISTRSKNLHPICSQRFWIQPGGYPTHKGFKLQSFNTTRDVTLCERPYLHLWFSVSYLTGDGWWRHRQSPKNGIWTPHSFTK